MTTPTPPTSPTYLTVREVADILSVSMMTVRRLIWAGNIKAVQVAQRCLRVESREVDRYLAAAVVKAVE